MFSFRTTPIADQLDKALLEGKVGVFCTPACWDAHTGEYLYDLFRRRGNLAAIFLPGEEAVPGTAHISSNPKRLPPWMPWWWRFRMRDRDISLSQSTYSA